MNVATIEVIGHHRLALKLLAEIISTGKARQFEGHAVESIACGAIAGGIIAWEKATPMELAKLVTTIGEALDIADDQIPTAADPEGEMGAEPAARVYPPA